MTSASAADIFAAFTFSAIDFIARQVHALVPEVASPHCLPMIQRPVSLIACLLFRFHYFIFIID